MEGIMEGIMEGTNVMFQWGRQNERIFFDNKDVIFKQFSVMSGLPCNTW